MKTLKKVIKAVILLLYKPRQFFKVFNSRIQPLPKSSVRKQIGEVLFDFDFNFDPEIRWMYHEVYEMDTVEAIKKFLKKGDTFIDVGASIGYITAVALNIVGETGQVHSFEPVPRFFDKLKKFATVNSKYKLVLNQYALSDKSGMSGINITSVSNIGWNTMVPGFMSEETIRETIEVSTGRLDDYIKEKALKNISVIKIDTEGFEFPVLKGLSGYFESTGERPVIICEIAPVAYPLLGYTISQLVEYMEKYNYCIFDIISKNTEVDITDFKETTNVLFIPRKYAVAKSIKHKLMDVAEYTKIYHLTKPLYSGIGHILMFHRVCPENEIKKLPGYVGIEMTPEHLESRIAYFQERGYVFLSPDELYNVLINGKTDKKFVVITFDDAYADIYTYAYPVLKKHRIPFAIYVTTAYPNKTAILWWYLLEELVSKNETVVFTMDGSIKKFNCFTEQEKRNAYNSIRSIIIGSNESQYIDRLKSIFEPYGIDMFRRTNEMALGWDAIRELSKDPLITIGSHTVNHYALSRLSESVAEYEILESKRNIEEHIGKKVLHFSYPFGGHFEAGKREFKMVKQCGFKTAVTTRAANIFRGHRDYPERLPRLDLGATITAQRLKFMTSGFTHCINNRFKRVVTV